MPPDRRRTGKQKRLHTLLRLICLRGLSTAGSVSVTPFPPLLAAHPSISSFSTPPPYNSVLLAVDSVIRSGLTSGGPLVLGGQRRRLIARQRQPPHSLWEPRTQPTSTQWPRTSATKTHGGEDVRVFRESTHMHTFYELWHV